MNNILTLKGHFEQRPNPSSFGPLNLPKNKCVTSTHLRTMSAQLQDILKFWTQHREIAGALVSVHYKHVVAKSNRIRILLSDNGKAPRRQFVVQNSFGNLIEMENSFRSTYLHIMSL